MRLPLLHAYTMDVMTRALCGHDVAREIRCLSVTQTALLLSLAPSDDEYRDDETMFD